MTMRNQRGEITIVLLIAAMLGTAVVVGLGPRLPLVNKLFKEQTAAGRKASWTKQIEKSKPVALYDKNGNAVALGTEYERLYDTGIEQSTPKLTLGENIGKFFASLTTAGLIFVGVSLAFFGGAPLVYVARKYGDAKHALTKTVMAVREMKKDDPALFAEKIAPQLAAAHDEKDRKVIDKIKTKLN